MGFFSNLFSRTQEAVKPVEIDPIEYSGFLIYPESIAENGQYRIAGYIRKYFGEELKTHRFIRSDLLLTSGDADELMLKKAQMFIDQMGDKIF